MFRDLGATLAQLGERQTEVDSVNSSEGLVFDPQKSQKVFFFFRVVISIYNFFFHVRTPD